MSIQLLVLSARVKKQKKKTKQNKKQKNNKTCGFANIFICSHADVEDTHCIECLVFVSFEDRPVPRRPPPGHAAVPAAGPVLRAAAVRPPRHPQGAQEQRLHRRLLRQRKVRQVRLRHHKERQHCHGEVL